jgi:hypothetical protein
MNEPVNANLRHFSDYFSDLPPSLHPQLRVSFETDERHDMF